MTDFVDRLDNLKISVTSPGRTIQATYSVHKGIVVELIGPLSRSHTDESLAFEITKAVQGIQHGWSKAMTTLLAAGQGTAETQPSPRQRRYTEELSRLTGVGMSPRRCVQARWSNNGEFDARVRPGTLGRMDLREKQLITEVNLAIGEALESYGRQQRDLHKSVYDTNPYE